MKYLKLFENFDQEEYKGCGCCPDCTGESDCECCPDCSCSDDDECPICFESPENCECDYNKDDDDYDDDADEDFNDEDSNIDLSIELENKLRTLSDDSELTVDDFLEEFGVSPEHMTGFAWASILKNAEKYKSMSDEEFNKLYDEYKNSVNESLITEKNVATNSELWNQCKAWAKSKYDVWPSAYACGAAAKRYKSKGGRWKKKKSKKKSSKK
jgi:hypothetical protein